MLSILLEYLVFIFLLYCVVLLIVWAFLGVDLLIAVLKEVLSCTKAASFITSADYLSVAPAVAFEAARCLECAVAYPRSI